MFSKISTIVVAALAASAVAAPWGEAQCNTSDVYCCNQVFQSGTTQYTAITALLGVAVGTLGAAAGVDCTPVTVIGAGSGASCTAQPVCCEENWQNGFVTAGCVPIHASA